MPTRTAAHRSGRLLRLATQADCKLLADNNIGAAFHALCCPKCGATRTKYLFYGLVRYETVVELGSTEPDFEFGWVASSKKAWHCPQCQHQWGTPAVADEVAAPTWRATASDG